MVHFNRGLKSQQVLDNKDPPCSKEVGVGRSVIHVGLIITDNGDVSI